MSNPNYIHLTWNDIQSSCINICYHMSLYDYKPDYIIGLMKGGVVPARIFADYFNVRFDFYTLNVSLYSGINKRDKLVIQDFNIKMNNKKVLIVDDILDSGKTMLGVLKYLKNKKTDFKTATLYWKETALTKPDYYDQIALKNDWVVFPWETYEFKRELKGE